MADVHNTLNNHDRRLRQLETRTSSASSGAQGIQGTSGSSGTVGGVPYTFSTTITDADPGAGIVRYNNATIASVTSIFIDNLDGLGVTQTAWYDTWDDSTNLTVRGTITIQGSASGSTVMNMFNVTGAVTVASGYYKIPVAYVSGSLPADATSLVVRFSRTGNQGDKGGLRYAFSTTTTMADPGSGTIRFNNATFASITAIAIDDLDKNAVDVSAYIVSWDDSGTSLNRGTLEIKSNSNSGTQIALFKVTALTDNAGWTQLTVTPLSGSVPANADELVVSFHRTGLQGTAGTGSTDIILDANTSSDTTTYLVLVGDTTTGTAQTPFVSNLRYNALDYQLRTSPVGSKGLVAAGSTEMSDDGTYSTLFGYRNRLYLESNSTINSDTIAATTVTSATANLNINTAGANALRTITSTYKVKNEISPLNSLTTLSSVVPNDKVSELNFVDYKNILSITPVTFKSTIASDDTESINIGFISEDIAEKFPELATYNSEGVPEYYNVNSIVSCLVALVQEQQKRIEVLEEALKNNSM